MDMNQSPFVMKVIKVYHKPEIKKVGITAQIISGHKFIPPVEALFTCSETGTRWRVSGQTFIPTKVLIKGILILSLEMVGQGLSLESGHKLTLISEREE